MGHRGSHKRYRKIFWNKWKWEHDKNQNLGDLEKVVLSGKLAALNANIRKGKSWFNDPSLHL